MIATFTRYRKRLMLAAYSFIAVALLSGVLTAHAADFREGAEAYKRGDYATALRILRQLAEQGNATAQSSLGLMYDKGKGVPQDYKEAVKWYRKAANQGNVNAQSNLGVMYGNGHGVTQDYKEAVRWYRKAADQGNADAQFNLGVMYGNGHGVPQDYVQAHMWFNLAAAQGMDEARKNRDIVAKKMSVEQIAQAKKLAQEWKPIRLRLL